MPGITATVGAIADGQLALAANWVGGSISPGGSGNSKAQKEIGPGRGPPVITWKIGGSDDAPEKERNLEAACPWTFLYNTDPERRCDELADDFEFHAPGRGIHRTTGGREPYRPVLRANLVAMPDRRERVDRACCERRQGLRGGVLGGHEHRRTPGVRPARGPS